MSLLRAAIIELNREHSKNTRLSRWYLVPESINGTPSFSVKRQVIASSGKIKFQRFPAKFYRDLRDSEEELREFVIRLNAQLDATARIRDQIEIRHAFINEQLLSEYLVHLKNQIPNQKNSAKLFSYTKRYFLHFYITKLRIPDPLEWHKNQSIWAQALLNKFDKEIAPEKVDRIRIWKKNRTPVKTTIQQVIANANRFMKWLHQQRPAEVPPLEFNPVSAAALKTLEARRILKGLKKRKWFVTDADWKTIRESATDELLVKAEISYEFGLRRAEVLGLEPNDVRKGYLSIERQLASLPSKETPITDILKGKQKRKVPYFFATGENGPERTHKRITKLKKSLVSPDRLTKLWSALMEELEMPYEFHDLRRTWITKCFRVEGLLPTDIQLAAGHENIETTMQYKLDDRQLDDEIFVPRD